MGDKDTVRAAVFPWKADLLIAVLCFTLALTNLLICLCFSKETKVKYITHVGSCAIMVVFQSFDENVLRNASLNTGSYYIMPDGIFTKQNVEYNVKMVTLIFMLLDICSLVCYL